MFSVQVDRFISGMQHLLMLNSGNWHLSHFSAAESLGNEKPQYQGEREPIFVVATVTKRRTTSG
ncbi:hypothetical protein [Rhodopirellula sp. SWK7]|uniref:hypothetical protein n=1 Tax=Rhodopirellula sp. SWK7 TaxID=595460 RepID=UPI0002C0106D|nr:hypothetical protein [Rhodopirellula sp. SWK7]EMI44299.1 hypothetical protein RRSWK_03100 [Rhodopirellula sp. SWK7]